MNADDCDLGHAGAEHARDLRSRTTGASAQTAVLRSRESIERGLELLASSAAALARSDALLRTAAAPGGPVGPGIQPVNGNALREIVPSPREQTSGWRQQWMRQQIAAAAIRLAQTADRAARVHERMAAEEPAWGSGSRLAAVRARKAAVHARQVANGLVPYPRRSG